MSDVIPTRKEDIRLLTGRARFVDDVHLDRMAHVVFVRSPVAHAEIASLDVSAARDAGALAVFTARDLPFVDRTLISRYWHPSIRGGLAPLMALDRVRYVGEAVALVVAADRYAAEDLAELVEVDYRELPPVATPAAAMAPTAPRLHDAWVDNIAAAFDHTCGDAAAAMARAPKRLKRRFTFGRQTGLPLETRGCVADFDADRNRLTAWVSTQTHYNVRNNLAELLGLPEYDVQVVAEDVGGGFGAKSRPYAEEVIVSHVSRALGRPVKWIEDRLESMVATTHSRSTDTDLEVGYDADGRILALRGSLVVDIGAYIFTSGIVTAQVASGQCAGPYRIENIDLEVRCVGTNKTPLATYRGAGQPEATFPMERLLDEIARDVGISAPEARLRNIVRAADMPYRAHIPYGGSEVEFESGAFDTMVKRAADASGYRETVERLESGEVAAWGLACGIECTGFVGFESARVRIDPNGNVTVFSGMSSQGQGQTTTYAQVAAETLGVGIDRVSVRLGDTDNLAFGRGAFASRGAVVGGNAVAGAAGKLRDKVLGHAATLLQCNLDELSVDEGRIVRGGAATDLGLPEIARAIMPMGPLYGGDLSLEEDFIYDTKGTLTFALSVHATRVAVDRQTGLYRLLDYYVLHDAGRMLNAAIVEGQIVGGVVDGIGCAMLAELLYDEGGQLVTGTLADYLLITATGSPRIRLDHVETRPTTNPLGVRGVGEGGVIPAPPAIVNAIARIVVDGSGDTAFLAHVPLSPSNVLKALGSKPATSEADLQR